MAIVNPTTAEPTTSTVQTVGYLTTTAVMVRDVGSKIFYVDPSAAPFTLLSSRTGSKPAMNPRFEWYEKSLRDYQTQINAGAGYLTTDTALTIDGSGTPRVNDVVKVTRTGENMLVTAYAAPILTVVRAFGETAAAALVDNDDLFIVGSAWKEGVDAGLPEEWQEAQVFNLTQIFRRQFSASGTREASETYFGQTRPRLRAEAAIQHALDIERSFIFGERAEKTDEAGANDVRRQTRGFLKFATANVKDASGTLTENELEDWLADVFKRTAAGDSRTLFASGKVVSVIDQLGAARLQMVPSDKTYGIAVGQYQTSHGRLNIVKDRILEAGLSSATSDYEGFALAVEPKMIKQRVLSGRATKLRENVQAPGVDGWIDEYLTECGLELNIPSVHGVLKNADA